MQNGTIVTWKEGWRFPIKLNIHLPQDPAIPLLVIYSREIKTHVLVLSLWHTIIWGSQKLEKTQVPTSRGKGTQTAVYSHNGKLLSKRTDQTSEKQQCGWVSAHYIEQKKPDKWVYQYDSIYISSKTGEVRAWWQKSD